MRLLLPCLLTTLALGVAGCGGSSDLLGADGQSQAGPVGAWVLRAAEPAITVPTGARITLTVTAEDGTTRVSGTAACNGYGGAVVLDDGGWRPVDGGFAITEMGCEAPLQQAEAAYMQALTQVDAWERVDPSTLRLTGPDAALTFDALEPVEPAAFTGTSWVVDGYVSGAGVDGSVASGMADTPQATMRFDENGTFTMFSGCRAFAGDWVVTGDEVQLTSWGETADSPGVAEDGSPSCDQPAIEQERRVLDVLEAGFTTSTEGQRLTLTHGEVGLSLRPGE